MEISLKPEHLKRYRDIAWLFMKYGRSDLVKKAGLEEVLEEEMATTASVAPKAENLASDLEKLGPTYIKLAQLLSTRADLLPPAYLDALARLQDDVEPFSFGEVEKIVSSELGVRMSKAFSEFESKPVAAASLGQVHGARMRDGRPVVVKVQRPNIREQIEQDLEALMEVATFLDKHTETGKRYEFQVMASEVRKTLLRELDYRQEARNLVTFGENLREFERIIVPQPIEDYTTSRVLTMDYVQGKKITSLSPLARVDLDGGELADHLFNAYLQQILVDGFFHADPHPGNVFLTDDGSIALIDLGMVARLAPRLQEGLLQLLLAISEGRGNEAAELAIKLGEPKEDFNGPKFQRLVTELVVQHQAVRVENIDAGRAVLEITRISGECGFRLPPEFTIFGKTLLNLDQVVHTLDPKFEPNAAIRRHATEIMRQRMLKSVSPGNIFTTILEVKDFAEKLPGRINNLLDAVANNELEIKIDAIDETKLMEGLQKIANRITLGLVLAALIVGAATSLYGGIAELGFVAGPAVAAPALLVVGAGDLLMANAVTFAISAGALTRLSLDAPAAGAGGRARPPLGAEVLAGLREVATLPGIRVVIAASAGFMLSGGVFNVVELPFAIEGLRIEASGYSILVAVIGLGLIAGSLAGSGGGEAPRLKRRYLMGLVIMGSGGIVAGASLSAPLAFVGFALAGFGNGLFLVHERLLFQTQTEPRLQGRVFGISDAVASWGFAAGFIAAGGFAELVGPQHAILLTGVYEILLAGLTAAALRSRWRRDQAWTLARVPEAA